jgi:hypothetical protein
MSLNSQTWGQAFHIGDPAVLCLPAKLIAAPDSLATAADLMAAAIHTLLAFSLNTVQYIANSELGAVEIQAILSS